MIIEVPLSQEPSKIYKILLNGQQCTIKLYQKGKNIFLNLAVDDEVICQGAICLNLVPIIQTTARNFKGNLVFADILGNTAPHFEGLGIRYFLSYFTEDEELPNVIKSKV